MPFDDSHFYFKSIEHQFGPKRNIGQPMTRRERPQPQPLIGTPSIPIPTPTPAVSPPPQPDHCSAQPIVTPPNPIPSPHSPTPTNDWQVVNTATKVDLSTTSVPSTTHLDDTVSTSRSEVSLECLLCREKFSLSPTGNIKIRELPCGHLLCQRCIDQLVIDQRVIIDCPGCHSNHDMSDYGFEWDASTQFASEDYRSPSPIAATVKHAEIALFEKVKKIYKLCKNGCDDPPTHFCSDCGYLCTVCDAETHQFLLANHKREALADQQLKKLKEREAKKKQRLDEVNSATDELNKIRNETNEEFRLGLEYAKCTRNHFVEQSNRLRELKAQIEAWEQENDQQQQLCIVSLDDLDQQAAKLQQLMEIKEREISEAKQLEIDQWDAKFKELTSLDVINEAEIKLKTSWHQLNPPLEFYPLTQLVRQLRLPNLFPSLTLNLKETLANKFLKQSGKSLDGAALLYKASLHGFTKNDFVRHCLGKSHTLILVKVAGNGYVFGAYIAPEITEQAGGVPDPTLKSFLFSLLNDPHIPFRLSLTDNRSAMDLSGPSVTFGHTKNEEWFREPMHYFNLILFHEGFAANNPQGNLSNIPDKIKSYQLDEESKTSLGGYEILQKSISGSWVFGANEIEVYQLSTPPPSPSTPSSSSTSSH